MPGNLSKLAFVCVQNAGRSQMASAFAEREKKRRGLDVEVLTGGTDPAEQVHPEVVDAMAERDIDLSDRRPRHIDSETLEDADFVLTMGCSAEDVCPNTGDVDTRDWDLDDPHNQDLETVRRIRDEIEERVRAFFDELQFS